MAKLSQLLLYDPDPSGLETLAYVFKKEGCAVTGTGDGSEVVGLVNDAQGSPLVLIALREPEQAGIDLIRDITGNPRTRNVACVAIGPQRFRGPALEAGAFNLLASPVFLRDVLDASKLVAAATVTGSRPSADTEVSIKLSELGGIYYLVRALAAAGRSAAVEIVRGPRRGELRFIDGELSSVQVGALSGLSALHQALLWSEAELRLKFRNIVRRAGQLSLKSEELIEECDRFLRDFAHEVKDLGVSGTIYRPSDEARPTANLPSEVVPLLRLFDGTRTLAQILDESPFRVFDTLRIVRQFASAEAIRAAAVPPPHPSSTLPGPAALATWFQDPPPVAEEDRPTPLPEPLEPRENSSRHARPASPVPPPVRAGEAAVPRTAKRTLTRRDYPIKTPIEPITAQNDAVTPPAELIVPPPLATPAPPTVAAALPPPLAAPPPAASSTPIVAPETPLSVEPTTPPPLVEAPPFNAELPRAPARSVARGEIQIAAALPLRKIERTPKPNAPSVMVELGAIPQPLAAAPVIEAPLTAQFIPPPVTSGSAPVKAPVLRRKTPAPGTAEPAPRVRTPSSGFSAMESEFFDREADLYKRESVESFDDLEGAAGTRNGFPRKP